jgi:hypothetical protein
MMIFIPKPIDLGVRVDARFVYPRIAFGPLILFYLTERISPQQDTGIP